LKNHFKALKLTQDKILVHQGKILQRLQNFEKEALGFLAENPLEG